MVADLTSALRVFRKQWREIVLHNAHGLRRIAKYIHDGCVHVFTPKFAGISLRTLTHDFFPASKNIQISMRVCRKGAGE